MLYLVEEECLSSYRDRTQGVEWVWGIDLGRDMIC